jgi:nitroreductase
MIDIFDIIHQRTSIRKYQDSPVPDQVLEKILAGGQRAPFTGQQCTVILTTDPDKRQKVAEWLGYLPREAPVYMLFCVDFRRLRRIVARYQRELSFANIALLWWGIQDVCYFAENVVIAGQAMGLGSCFMGGTPWRSDELCDLFQIPQMVFPIVGLVMGYPAEQPAPRARIPLKYVVHRDRYHDLTEQQLTEAIQVMDLDVLKEGYYRKYTTGFRHMEGEPELSDEEYTYGEHTSRKFGTGFGEDLRNRLARQGIAL